MTQTATGTLAATPLAHGLIYARNRRLTGRLELHSEDKKAVVSIWRGQISAVETSPAGMVSGGYLGAVLYELGFIDSNVLDETLLEIAKTKRLHGEVLVERKAITTQQRDAGLVEQIHRKVHHLFSFPDSATYSFYDAAAAPIEPPVKVDTVGPVWRGIRDYPPLKFVHETIRRVGDQALRRSAGETPVHLPPLEGALLTALSTRTMTLDEMKQSTELPAAKVELLVYLLVIAKCVEAVSGARTHPSTGALPIAMKSGIITPVNVRRPSGSTTAVAALAAAVPTPPPAGSLAALRTPAEIGHEGVVKRAAMVEDETLFEVLGVADGASAEAVRAAYMRLAKSWHPDRLETAYQPLRDEVAKIFAHMTNAQKTLTDAERRRAYVALRAAKTTAPPRADTLTEINTAFERRNFERVMLLCQKLIDIDSDDSEAIAVQAWASIKGGEATEDELRGALVKMDRAVNVDRTNAQAVFHRGLVHKRLNNIPVAFRDFARALQLDPAHTGAEREVRILAMRVRKGSGEHKLIAPILEKIGEKK